MSRKDANESRARARDLAWALVLLVGLVGCARLEQISDEGGLVGRLSSRGAPSAESASPEPDCTPEEPAVATQNAPSSEPEIIGPYRPTDFEEHAVDGEFEWHWTATRSGDRVEVKGLIHNRGSSPVQGVTFGVRSQGTTVRAAAPGLIRPGQMRPFSFAVALPGEGQPLQLSIVRVDRAVVESALKRTKPMARRCERPQEAVKTLAKQFSNHAEDGFFSIHWNTTKKDGAIEVHGVVENQGPPIRQVILIVKALGPGAESLTTRHLTLWGLFEKREARPFDITLSVPAPPERVSVIVQSFQYDLKGF